ncbi:tRNA A64-2'-O-ribosylphosphate transferase [Biscogniauxia mediterranea]|nr:tRNA A64-2'-O-ribosylphosphate transferase [Biscogniauxia mediterranea]
MATDTPPAELQQPSDEDDATTTSLLLSAAQPPRISHVLADVRRANLSMGNRLRSVVDDAAFVAEVGRAYGGRPLVANERCGSWYVAPRAKAASAYFKSTDGHAGQWRFSARRLNLHLLPLVGRHDGCVVVDSTRRGKAMPDALTKTLPIWCCVVNRVLFPELGRGRGRGRGYGERGEEEGEEEGEEGEVDYHALFTPPTAVSPSEHAQIEARIPAHVAALRALDIDTAALRAHIRKPLRPIWVTPESHLPSPPPPSPSTTTTLTTTTTADEGAAAAAAVKVFDDFHPIICCTASRRAGSETDTDTDTDTATAGGYSYVQGAGDDTENWALGLTPALFWAHADELLQLQQQLSEAELRRRVQELVASSSASSASAGGGAGQRTRQVAPRVHVARLPLLLPKEEEEEEEEGGERAAEDVAYVCIVPRTTDPADWVRGPRRLEVGVGKNAKVAGRNLRVALPRVCEFVCGFFEGRSLPSSSFSSGADVDVGNNAGDIPTQKSRGRRGELDDGDESAQSQKEKSVVIACETGGDLAVGVALALLCRCFDAQGRYDGGGEAAGITKSLIRLRLGRIMMAFPEANPSRATLQSVNSFLMG